MSGIVGIVNLDGAPIDRDRLRQLTDALAWRGPDRQAIWCDGPVGFGHALLATTFEARRERQPCSLDGQVWITADARIDGRDELKARLRGKVDGALDEATDVELILHAYAVWGEDCVRHLLGDFVFAIRDGRENKLFCARDHFGVKCLFHARVGNTLLIGNDLDGLRRHPGLSDERDELFIADFLLFGHSKEPEASAYQAIRRLPPAHTLSASLGGEPVTRRYWDLPLPEEIRYRRDEDYIAHFLELFKLAVTDRLRTDRVAISMSGGMDSSSVAAMAVANSQQQLPGPRIDAFCRVFDHLMVDDERHFAGLAATYLQIPIRFFPTDEHPVFADCEQTPEPCAVLSSLNGFRQDTAAALGDARVMLTGYGGDPAFLPDKNLLIRGLSRPMSWHRFATDLYRHYRWHGHLPPLGLKWRLKHTARPPHRMLPLPPWLDDDLVQRFDLRKRFERMRFATLPAFSARREATKRALTDPVWPSLFGIFSAPTLHLAHETRHPFFDPRLLHFLLALPNAPWVTNKQLLRTAMRNHLPSAIVERQKTPLRDFPSALRARRDQGWRDRLRPALDAGTASRFVKRDRFHEVLESHAMLRKHLYHFWVDRPASLIFWIARND